jgi:EPS-associated MarR family transcriptional regulator
MTTTEVDLPVLEALAAEPSLSQRELAQRVGLSLTRAHFVLKRLTSRGLVKVRNAAQSDHKLGYLYLLTPEGLEEKARLTLAFLHHTAAQYKGMADRVEAALEEGLEGLPTGEPRAVVVVGEGPLAQVVRDLVTLRGDLRLVEDHAEACIAVDVTARGRAHEAHGTERPRTVRLA